MLFPAELGVSSDEPGYRMNASKRKNESFNEESVDKLKGSNMGNDSTGLTR